MTASGRDVSHLIGATNYIDFKAFGCRADPIVYGGSFNRLPLGSTVADRK